MADDPGPTAQPKSLADILAEELDGKIGTDQTQELPLEEKQERLRAVYDRIHAEQPERSALCLSGGGIRSAIFSLGVLQGLARHGLLGGDLRRRCPGHRTAARKAEVDRWPRQGRARLRWRRLPSSMP